MWDRARFTYNVKVTEQDGKANVELRHELDDRWFFTVVARYLGTGMALI